MENLVRRRRPDWVLIFKALTIAAVFFGSAWLLLGAAFDTLFSGVPIAFESPKGNRGATWISFGQHLEPTMVHTANVHRRPLRHLARVDNTSVAVARVDANVLESPEVFKAVHKNGGCGGYFRHDSLEEAVEASKVPVGRRILQHTKITQQKLAEVMLPMIDPKRMATLISTLSENFPNRFLTSKAGVDAAKLVEKTWKDALKGLTSFASVRLHTHRDFEQPSVIATLKGRTSPERIIIIGAHFDSIVGGPDDVIPPDQVETFHAPGADDNASGLACVTEILKVFAENGQQPEVTLEFMGYAGEELGLLGSDEIAKQYKKDGKDVHAMLNLDMTGWHGASKSIYFVTGYADGNLNTYLQSLLKAYLPDYSFGETEHPYASSDHASWHKQGYSATLIIEGPIDNMNPNYHSVGDTLAGMGGNANVAARFAQLGLLCAVEMAFGTATVIPARDPEKSDECDGLKKKKCKNNASCRWTQKRKQAKSKCVARRACDGLKKKKCEKKTSCRWTQERKPRKRKCVARRGSNRSTSIEDDSFPIVPIGIGGVVLVLAAGVRVLVYRSTSKRAGKSDSRGGRKSYGIE